MYQAKPQPINVPSSTVYCRVCGKVSYSRSGVHPQCAQNEADLKRLEIEKHSSPRPAEKLVHASELKAWHKRCPKCRGQVHVSKKACNCGHVFKRGV